MENRGEGADRNALGGEIPASQTQFSGSRQENRRHTLNNRAGIQIAIGTLTQPQGHRSGSSGGPLERGGFAGCERKPFRDFERVVRRLSLSQHRRQEDGDTRKDGEMHALFSDTNC